LKNKYKGEIKMSELESLIRQVLAIEILEYEDKNHLSGDNESRSRKKILLLSNAMEKIFEYKKNSTI
jgi:hypothetical protein